MRYGRIAVMAVILLLSGLAGTGGAAGNGMPLYVDAETHQVYSKPGPNRVPLQEVLAKEKAAAAAAREPEPHSFFKPGGKPKVNTATTFGGPEEKSWFERFSIRGYTQLRYHELLGGDTQNMNHQADKSVGQNRSAFIRRARLILFGDISEQVSLYIQPDFASEPSGSSTGNFGQLRDAYFDIFFDQHKEYRVRAGQSKVPFGFENMQSSQNRLGLDRDDAINSCCKDERDLGAFFYWTPTHVRKIFRDLVADGLKGSGDYGVFALGAYNGQGANRAERNDGMHIVSRLTYPYKFANGQIFEASIQGYKGQFSPPSVASGIKVLGSGTGIEDSRVALTAVLYPQPFGFQAEWEWGAGPELNLNTATIEKKDLAGGYAQVSYMHDTLRYGRWQPFVKYHYYDGAFKFETNAPSSKVRETEVGVEWQPRPELELTAVYVNTRRSNVLASPYAGIGGDLLRMQLQINY